MLEVLDNGKPTNMMDGQCEGRVRCKRDVSGARESDCGCGEGDHIYYNVA